MTRLPGLAERLDLLLRTAPRLATDPRPHTNELVAEALSAQGVEVSAVHILNLRAGRRDNPSLACWKAEHESSVSLSRFSSPTMGRELCLLSLASLVPCKTSICRN